VNKLYGTILFIQSIKIAHVLSWYCE